MFAAPLPLHIVTEIYADGFEARRNREYLCSAHFLSHFANFDVKKKSWFLPVTPIFFHESYFLDILNISIRKKNSRRGGRKGEATVNTLLVTSNKNYLKKYYLIIFKYYKITKPIMVA